MTVDEAIRWLDDDDPSSLATALAADPTLVVARSSLGDTLLHEACRQKKPWAVQLLLDQGADPNAPGDLGYTPLHCAVRDCPAEEAELVVSALLARGADPSLRDVVGADVVQHVLERHEIWDDPERIVRLLRP